MGRSTQYVGLTKAAIEYAEKHALRRESYVMTTGMFQEPVEGSIWHLPPPEGPNKECILKEVVQTEPWSSGPMIFTHLQPILIKESGQVIDDSDHFFSWVLDPSLKERNYEYDQVTGTYYV